MKKKKGKGGRYMMDIRKIFSDPNALRKTIEIWKQAERRGLWVIKYFEEVKT